MRMTTNTACASTLSRRIVSLALILVACSFSGGCASWNSFREHHTPLAGRFWHRPAKPDQDAGYDLYAESVAAARPKGAREAAAAARPSNPRDKDRSSSTSSRDPSASDEKVARAEPRPPRVSPTPDRTPRRTEDTAIRVTLGRPESLPTLTDTGTATAPLLASSTNWKRPGGTTAETRTVPRPRPSTSINGDVSEQPDSNEDRPARLARDEKPPARVASQPPRAASSDDQLRTILVKARSKLESMSTYQVNITRVERVGSQLQPEEEVVLSIRRKPKAVRLEWAKGPSKGREVIYSSAINGRMMYVNMANSALPIPRMSIPIDSPMVLRNSRHPITEAGFDTIFDGLEKYGAADAAGIRQDGKLVYRGIERPKGLDLPCHLLERTTPKGETWQVYLETRTLMPAVAVAFQTKSGELIERYTYQELKPNPAELAAADAFDPDKRWGEPKGLLSRLARAAATSADANSGPTTTR
jgi:hypothetical protein